MQCDYFDAGRCRSCTLMGTPYDEQLAAKQHRATVALADVAMFAPEIAAGQLVVPYDAAIDDGFGYYLKLRADDLADPTVSLFRSWLIAQFAARQ